MNAYEYIMARQTAWANRHEISLIGRNVERGRPAYVPKLEQNLFQPLLPNVRDAFKVGRGDELGLREYPGKMQAVHSSSALGVNVFQYWQSLPEVPVIAAACGLCRRGSGAARELRFEDQYPIINARDVPPHISDALYRCPRCGIFDMRFEPIGNWE
jgi:hypothetical protein